MTREQVAEAQRRASEFLAKRQPAIAGPDQKNEIPVYGSAEAHKSSGSGVFISDDGTLVTNSHVVNGAVRLIVKTKQGCFPAKVLTLDSVNDIAVLKVSGSGFH